MKPLNIYLYHEPSSPSLGVEEVADYLRCFGLGVEVRGAFIPFHLGNLPLGERAEASEGLAPGFARLKIRNPLRPELAASPLPGEIDYERRRLRESPELFGIAYEGVGVMRLLAGLLPQKERGLSSLHLIFTNQLLATWGEGRYHLRVVLLGFPCLLSVTGASEAPAKPREYYILKQQYTALGMGDAVVELEKELGGRVLSHGDPRLSEVMKGYALQAVFYHREGEAFCPDPDCRLFNAHWQEEMLRAQLQSGRLCSQHQQMAARWQEG